MRWPFVLWGSLLLLVGCGSEMPGGSAARSRAKTDIRGAAEGVAPLPQADGEAAATPTAPPERKIIYTASLDLLVEDMGRVEVEVPKLVRSFGGYISGQDLSGATGYQRRGSWTIRIPVDRFDLFLAEVAALGEVERNRRDSKDVTEQFFDTEARLKNKKVAEQRLVKLLEERTGKLEDVLTVEKELSRVRGEAEQLEGSLRLLTNLTSLTTVNLTVTERKDYKPPLAPSFGTTIGRTFEDSLNALIALGKGIVLIAVALAPWIPLLAAFGLGLWFLVRRLATIGSRPRLASAADAFLDRP